jgi:lipopolysaccharide export system protein LptC
MEAPADGGHNFAIAIGQRWRGDQRSGDASVTDAEPTATPAAGRVGSRAYRQAQRHSSRVRFFRLLIPIGAAIAVGFVAIVAVFDPFGRLGAGLRLGSLSLSGTKITMENPRLSGYRDDRRGYEVTADAALQDVRKPTLIELKGMKARLVLDDAGHAARLEAATGVFDTQKEFLEVRSDVRVRTDQGQEADLVSALIDFKAGTVQSNDPVEVRLPQATINAKGLSIRDNGKVITFVGEVKTVFDTAAAQGRDAAATPAPASPEPALASAPQAEQTSLPR